MNFIKTINMLDKRISLSMIVKNEAPVIKRCLESVRPWIDQWVIVDTGSTDGTQQLVQEAMAGIPGTLYERPWVDFAHNRNEALAFARQKADYVLFIDADEQLHLPDGFRWPHLDADGYLFKCILNTTQYSRNSLISTRRNWAWEGVIHEYLTCPEPHEWQLLPGPEIHVSRDGARARDPSTYLKDIEVLKKALTKQPGHPRYTFYIAQSYRDAGLLSESLTQYEKRVGLQGWAEETWYAAFQVAVLTEKLHRSSIDVQQAYLRAYAMRSGRAEPLYELSRYLRLQGETVLAHLYALRASRIKKTEDLLFVDSSVYEWRALDELASAAWYAGALDDGRMACEQLLAEGKFPETERARIESNSKFY